MTADSAAPVKFGMVGYGFGGRYFHTPLIVAAPECELVRSHDVLAGASGAGGS